MNMYTQLFLKKLSNNHRIPELLNKVIVVSRMFHLNELEITVWSLWLEKLNWKLGDLSLETFLFVTGAQAKAYLSPEIEMEVYFKKLGNDFPKARVAYESWIKVGSHNIDLSIHAINKEYKRLKQFCSLHPSQDAGGVDYNKAVDDLLHMSSHKLPYNASCKSQKQSNEIFYSLDVERKVSSKLFKVDHTMGLNLDAKKEELVDGENKEKEQSKLSFEDSVSIPEFVRVDSFANIKDSHVSLMKINSLFSYVDPEELLRNNSGVSWQVNDVRLQMTTKEKKLQES